ncbi:MAG: hypothetical protein IT204_23385 [Fimbriimonadaceae bacterium]|nr:hypothetical protein [Fimbriimonadaceae bacterium]
MTFECANCRARLTTAQEAGLGRPVCPCCGAALATSGGPRLWPELDSGLPELEDVAWESITLDEPSPTPEQLQHLNRVVDLSAELPTLALGARALDLSAATPTTGGQFLQQLTAAKEAAAACARRAVILQREIDRHFDHLTYPALPAVPPDQGIFNQLERNQALVRRATIRARQQADVRLHDQLGSMLTVLWEALAKHLAIIESAICDCRGLMGLPALDLALAESDPPAAPAPRRV